MVTIPSPGGPSFLTDGGLETDLIFNRDAIVFVGEVRRRLDGIEAAVGRGRSARGRVRRRRAP
jgi:hypothetical protein